MTNSVAMVAEGLNKLALQRSQEALENGALRPLSTDIETWAGTSNGGFEIRHLVGAPPPAPQGSGSETESLPPLGSAPRADARW